MDHNIDKKSEKTKFYSLHPTMHSYNAYFNNDTAFCAFHFPYIDEPRLKDQFNGTMFNFGDRLDVRCMAMGSFERELTNGDVLIFSTGIYNLSPFWYSTCKKSFFNPDFVKVTTPW